jgi:hypothetical protein
MAALFFTEPASAFNIHFSALDISLLFTLNFGIENYLGGKKRFLQYM